MTLALRFATVLLAALVASTGTAAAQDASLVGDWRLETDDTVLGGEAAVHEEGRYADLDAGALTEEGAAALDTDASVSSAEDAAAGNAWAWLQIRFSAVLDALLGLTERVGLEAPAEADVDAEVYASAEGIDVDAHAGDLVFDESPVGDADGLTWEASATAKGAAGVGPS